MFSGIINEVGSIKQKTKHAQGLRLSIQAPVLSHRLKAGASIAVNGACLTVTASNPPLLSFDISPSTMEVTLFADYELETLVNLEPAVRASTPLDGHIVQGHVDGISSLTNITRHGDFADFSFQMPPDLSDYISYKGSLAIDGISLTVAKLSAEEFSIAVVPYTLENTNLKRLKVGQEVHLETDLIARYLKRLLDKRQYK